MDYLGWELARQRAALWALLGGGDTEEEAGPSARGGGGAETGAASRQRAPEEARRTPRFGTGGAAVPSEPSGGRNAFETVWETEEESGMEARLAAEAAGGRRAEGDFAAGGAAWKPGPTSEGRTGGGEAAGDTFAAPGRGGTGTARPGGGAPAETAGQGGRRVLPWEGGRESAALRAEAEARALSRAVQRDARRYDGGFTIY